MRLLKNRFLIKADPDQKKTISIEGLDGKPFLLATQYDPYRYSTQIGEIYEAPLEFSEDSIDTHTLKKGDTIYFHHHVCQPKNEWLIKNESFYQCGYKQIWAKVENGQLVPVNDWIFVEPILESEDEMFAGGLRLHATQENLQQIGTAFAVSQYAQDMGIKKGDRVHFVKDADYEIEIDGKLLWRMKVAAVIAIEEDELLYPLADKILIKEDERDDRVWRGGLLMPASERPKQFYGSVVSVGKNAEVVKPDDRVCFFHGMSTRMYFQDEEYAIIKKENIVYAGNC